MSERPTPRTDKAEYEVRLGRYRRMVVRPELARELELELADAREELEREKRRAEENGVLAHELGIQLAETRNQRDQLADACRWAQIELGKHTRPSPIDAALATVKNSKNVPSVAQSHDQKS